MGENGRVNKDLFVGSKIYVPCFACTSFGGAIEKSIDSLELTNTPERLR